MFSCLQILEAFLWFVLITLLNVTLIILTLSVSRLLNLLLRSEERRVGKEVRRWSKIRVRIQNRSTARETIINATAVHQTRARIKYTLFFLKGEDVGFFFHAVDGIRGRSRHSC